MDYKNQQPVNKLTKDEFLSALRKVLSHDSCDRWFAPAEYLFPDEVTCEIRVPNLIHQVWIESNFMPQVKTALLDLTERDIEIRFSVLDDGTSSQEHPEPLAQTIEVHNSEPKHLQNGLIERYTFDNYVIGANNQLAVSAAQAVLEKPGPTYNPLFIHGSTGLGKTHLLHAIGNAIQKRKKHFKVAYLTSEEFFNQFVNALQTNTLPKFRKKMRGLDLLMIDDVQFLSGKDKTQEEFFYTFNTLYDGLKQIVLASDRPPAEIGQLEDRLVSRFEWGMTAQLASPDVETRMAILLNKLDTMQVDLSNEVVEFIATRIRSNVRRLEGALIRVASHASFQGSSLSVAAAESVLRDYLEAESRNRRTASPDSIQKATAEIFDIRLADMTSKARPARIALPRQVAMFLTRKLTPCSLQEIGRAFGGRDHGTVLHACNTVAKKMEADPDLKSLVHQIEAKIEKGG